MHSDLNSILKFVSWTQTLISKCVVSDQLSGLVVRASALRLGGSGFDPRPSHTKDYYKNGTQFLPAWRSASGVGLGCAVTMWLSAYHDGLAGSWVRLPGPATFAVCLPPSLCLSCQSTVLSKIKAKSPPKYKSLLFQGHLQETKDLRYMCTYMCTCFLDFSKIAD